MVFDEESELSMAVDDQIREIISNDIGWDGDPALLADDLSLIETVFDSLSSVQFVAVVTKRFGIEVNLATDLTRGNFETIPAIAAFIERKRLAAL
jgi:acyl carrier protein